MLELIPASAIIAIVVIALIVIFLAVGYVKAVSFRINQG